MIIDKTEFYLHTDAGTAYALHQEMSTLNNTDAAGTIFENCPATILNISVTFLLTTTMLPSKKCIYQTGANASVVLFNIGAGYVVYLGYDFYDSGPGCTQATTVCLLESGIGADTFGPTGVYLPSLNGERSCSLFPYQYSVFYT